MGFKSDHQVFLVSIVKLNKTKKQINKQTNKQTKDQKNVHKWFHNTGDFITFSARMVSQLKVQKKLVDYNL